MTKGELASAIDAEELPSPRHLFPSARGRLYLVAGLSRTKGSDGFRFGVIVAALAAALGGAMPLAVYGIGPRPVERVEPVRVLNSERPSASPIVARSPSLGKRRQSAEKPQTERGGSRTRARALAPAVAPGTKHEASLAGEEGSHPTAAGSTHASEAGASESPPEPEEASDQDEGSSEPLPDETEGEEGDG